MKLLTKELENKIPSLYETDGKDKKTIYAKFFNPVGSGTWYVLEYDKEGQIFFGAVDLGYGIELGYFSLEELESVKLPFNMKIERDKFWEPKDLSEIM
tara:strand:+ start:451 stop:744 length:294 start_codon:yes stop_codon:yes gene_type:complete